MPGNADSLVGRVFYDVDKRRYLPEAEVLKMGEDEIMRRMLIPYGQKGRLLETTDDTNGKHVPLTPQQVKDIEDRTNKDVTKHQAYYEVMQGSKTNPLPIPVNIPSANRGRSEGSSRGGSGPTLPGVNEDRPGSAPAAAWGRGGAGGAWGYSGGSGDGWDDDRSVAPSHVDNRDYPQPSVAPSNTPSKFWSETEPESVAAARANIQTLLEPDPSNKVNAILANAAAQIQLSRAEVKRAMEHRGFHPGASQSLVDDASNKLVESLQDLSWVRTYYALDLFRHWSAFKDDGLNLRLPAYIPEERAKSCLLNLTYAGDGTEELSLHCEVKQDFLQRGAKSLVPQNQQDLRKVLELLHARLRQHLDFVWGLKEARLARALEVGTQPRTQAVQAECAKDTQYCALATVVWALEDAIAQKQPDMESEMGLGPSQGLGVKVRSGGEFPPSVNDSDVCLGVQTQEEYKLQLDSFVHSTDSPAKFLPSWKAIVTSDLTLDYTHPVKRSMGIQYDEKTKKTINFVNFLQKKSQGEYSLVLKLDDREFLINFTEYGQYGHTWANSLSLRIGQTHITKSREKFEFRDKENWMHYINQNESSMTFTGKVNEIDCMVQAVRYLHWQLQTDTEQTKLETTVGMVNGWFDRLQTGDNTAVPQILAWSRAFYTTDSPDVRDLCSYGDRAAYCLYLRTDSGAYVSAVRTFTKSFPRSGKDGRPKPPKRVEDYAAAEAARNRPAPQRHHAPRPQQAEQAPPAQGGAFERARQLTRAQGRRPPGGGRGGGGDSFGENAQGIFNELADRMVRMEEALDRYVQAQQHAAFHAQPQQQQQPYGGGPGSSADESAVARIERMVAEALNIRARDDREADRKAQEQARKDEDKRRVIHMPEREQTEQQAAWGYGVDAADFSTAPAGLALHQDSGKVMQFNLDTERAEDTGILLYTWNGQGGDFAALYAVWVLEKGDIDRKWVWTMYTTRGGETRSEKATLTFRLMDSAREPASEKWIDGGAQPKRFTVSRSGSSVARSPLAMAGPVMSYIQSVNSRGKVFPVNQSHSAELRQPASYGPFQERYHLRMFQQFSSHPRHTDYLGEVPSTISVTLRPTLTTFYENGGAPTSQKLERIDLVFRCVDSVKPEYICADGDDTHILKRFYESGSLTWGWALKKPGVDEFFIACLAFSNQARYPEWEGPAPPLLLGQALIDDFNADMVFKYDLQGGNLKIESGGSSVILDYVMTAEQHPDAQMLRRETEGNAAYTDLLTNKCLADGMVQPFKAEFWTVKLKEEHKFMMELQNHYDGKVKTTTRVAGPGGRGMVNKTEFANVPRGYRPQFYMKVYDQATLEKNTDRRYFSKETQRMGDYNTPQFIWIDHPFLNGLHVERKAPVEDTKLVLVDNHGPVYVSVSGRFMLCPDAAMTQTTDGEPFARFRWALFVWVPAEGRYDLIMRKELGDSAGQRTLMSKAAPGVAQERHANAWQAYRQFINNEKIPQAQLDSFRGQKLDVSVHFDELQRESTGRNFRDNNPFKLVKRFPDHLRVISEQPTETRKDPRLTWEGAQVVPTYSRVTAPWTQKMDTFCSVLERHIPAALNMERVHGNAAAAMEHQESEENVRAAALQNRRSKDLAEGVVMNWHDQKDLKLFKTLINRLVSIKDTLTPQQGSDDYARAAKAFVDRKDNIEKNRDDFMYKPATRATQASYNAFMNLIGSAPSCIQLKLPMMSSLDHPNSQRTIDHSVHLVLHNPYTMEYYNPRLGLYLRTDKLTTDSRLMFVWRLYQYVPVPLDEDRPFTPPNGMYLFATKVFNPSNLMSPEQHVVLNKLHWRLNGAQVLRPRDELERLIHTQPVQPQVYYKDLVATIYKFSDGGVANRVERDATFNKTIELKNILLPTTIMDSYCNTFAQTAMQSTTDGILYDYSKDTSCLNLWSTFSVIWNPVLFFECPVSVKVTVGNFMFGMSLAHDTRSKIQFKCVLLNQLDRSTTFLRDYRLTAYLENADNKWVLYLEDTEDTGGDVPQSKQKYPVLQYNRNLLYNDQMKTMDATTKAKYGKADSTCTWNWDNDAVTALQERKQVNIKVQVQTGNRDSDDQVDFRDTEYMFDVPQARDSDAIMAAGQTDDYMSQVDIEVRVLCEWNDAFEKVKDKLAPFLDTFRNTPDIPSAALAAPVMTFAKWEPPRLGARW